MPPRIWVVTKNSLKGGRLRLLLSILSLQESVKCCHQNKHFFHVAPVCCITVVWQCNTVQTPKKIYQSSNNRNPSCCRLCGLVKDVNYCKNLFAEANKQLLAVAEDVYGRSLLRKVNEELRLTLTLTLDSICCTVDNILLRNNPPCGFGLSPRSRDQPQPGSLFSRSWGRGERDPGNEVD